MAEHQMSPTEFAAALTEKFPEYVFEEQGGIKWIRIAKRLSNGAGGRSVHCFVNRIDGRVYKDAGWSRPAAGARYESVEAALAVADPYGSYLYTKR